MATITITRGLTERAYGKTSILIPAFERNTMTFQVNGADLTGMYATVKIGAYEFRAVRTYTSMIQHDYIIDVTSILINLLPDLDLKFDTATLTYSPYPAIRINLYNSSNELVTLLDCPNVVVSHSYSNINTYSEVDISLKGSSRAIYHNGKKICFFWSGEDGLYEFSVGASSDNIDVSYGNYNLVNISVLTFGMMTGTLTTSALGTFSIPLYYKPPYGEHEIAWLNRDGGWSFWNFRQISSEIKVEKSNEVATYYPTNFATISKSRMMSAEKTVEYVFDTLAYNPEHFAQLCEIQESLAVIWNNKLMSVSGCNSLTSVCKQNLRFTLKLQSDENIAGY